jgi:hypothetical protein
MRSLPFVIALGLAVAPAPAIAEAHGQVTFVKGTLERQLGEARSAVVVGSAIDTGDHLFTGPQSLAEILFEDGSVIRLAPSSELEVKQLDVPPEGPSLKARLALVLGSVWSSVITLRGGGTYEVESTWAVAGVRGTRFRVDAQPTTGAVEVYRGQVEVAPSAATSTNEKAMVLPDHRLGLDATGAHPGPAAPLDAFGAWVTSRRCPTRADFTLHPIADDRAAERADRKAERRETRRERR